MKKKDNALLTCTLKFRFSTSKFTLIFEQGKELDIITISALPAGCSPVLVPLAFFKLT